MEPRLEMWFYDNGILKAYWFDDADHAHTTTLPPFLIDSVRTSVEAHQLIWDWVQEHPE